MNNGELKDRRKCERYPFREDIMIDGTRMSSSMDISEEGLYISAIQFYETDSLIDVTIPFKGEKFTVKAQIMHGQSGIGIGVMFVDLNDEQRANIKELIESIATKHGQPDIKEKNILLVEDNNTSREAIKSALANEGFCVIEASDGIEAMKYVAEENLNLIILDLFMKGIDGLKLLSVLKANPKWKDLPVMVCSGYDTQDIKDKVMTAGADAFISKRGTSPAKLAQSAKVLLENRHEI